MSKTLTILSSMQVTALAVLGREMPGLTLPMVSFRLVTNATMQTLHLLIQLKGQEFSVSSPPHPKLVESKLANDHDRGILTAFLCSLLIKKLEDEGVL